MTRRRRMKRRRKRKRRLLRKACLHRWACILIRCLWLFKMTRGERVCFMSPVFMLAVPPFSHPLACSFGFSFFCLSVPPFLALSLSLSLSLSRSVFFVFSLSLSIFLCLSQSLVLCCLYLSLSLSPSLAPLGSLSLSFFACLKAWFCSLFSYPYLCPHPLPRQEAYPPPWSHLDVCLHLYLQDCLCS